MNEIEQMVNEIVTSTRERIVSRFVGGEDIKWILEASPAIVEECLRQRIKALEAGQEDKKPRFGMVHCSQCGGGFGPGDYGYSHCEDHEGKVNLDP